MKTVAITFDYYPEAYTVAFPLMLQAGIVGTYFVDPDTVGQSFGPTRDNLTILKMSGWTIGAYSGINMVDALTNNRNVAMDRLIHIKQRFVDLGFPVRSLAPNQRAWDMRLRNIAVGLFDRVRVAADVGPQGLPLPDPLYIRYGCTPSLSGRDTVASINSQIDGFLAGEGDLWPIVVHKVRQAGDDYTVTVDVFNALLTRLAQERAGGTIRIVGFDDIL